MTRMDTEYYRARAEEEREAARNAREQFIADIHSELAEGYEALFAPSRVSIRPKGGR